MGRIQGPDDLLAVILLTFQLRAGVRTKHEVLAYLQPDWSSWLLNELERWWATFCAAQASGWTRARRLRNCCAALAELVLIIKRAFDNPARRPPAQSVARTAFTVAGMVLNDAGFQPLFANQAYPPPEFVTPFDVGRPDKLQAFLIDNTR